MYQVNYESIFNLEHRTLVDTGSIRLLLSTPIFGNPNIKSNGLDEYIFWDSKLI
jgi:hypothetical protein